MKHNKAYNSLQSAFEVKSTSENGGFSGYGSVFDVIDSYRDVVTAGAFAQTIATAQSKGRMPALLWQHDSSEPIGVISLLREDTTGLYMEGQFALDTQRGKEAHSLLKMGALNGLSIGYSTVQEDYDSSKNIRLLKAVDLWEVSLVTFPANDEARVTRVKSKPETLRDFEKHLREAGFTREEATTIALSGFKALSGTREAEDEAILSIKESIQRNIKILGVQ